MFADRKTDRQTDRRADKHDQKSSIEFLAQVISKLNKAQIYEVTCMRTVK